MATTFAKVLLKQVYVQVCFYPMLNRFLLSPPLRPLLLASPPLAGSVVWGRPLLFSPLFSPSFSGRS